MKIDHIGLVVDDVRTSVDWYIANWGASLIYCDDTWAFLQFENIKLALVVEGEHPAHIAFEDALLKGGKLHRDGSRSVYEKDPSGNFIERIRYDDEKNRKHALEDYHEGR
mgnify:FL=1|jgi:catechol 2,3-dioxygenase-like lactoylglutathione lyase family enzyme